MSNWQHMKKSGMYWIEQIQTYIVKVWRGIRHWSHKSQIASCSNRRSLRDFVCLFLLGATLSVAIAACEAVQLPKLM
jgi:sulfate transport system substrate-binding protein